MSLRPSVHPLLYQFFFLSFFFLLSSLDLILPEFWGKFNLSSGAAGRFIIEKTDWTEFFLNN